MVKHRLRTGRWLSVYRGVYAIAGAPRTDHQLVVAAVLSLGPNAVAAALTAAWLHGVVEGTTGLTYVLLPHGQHRRARPGLSIGEAGLRRSDIRSIDGIRVTGPHRTIVDLAPLLPARTLAAAFDEAVLLGLVTVTSMRRYIGGRRLERRPGAGKLRAILDDRTKGVPQKELERVFRRKLKTTDLPEPLRQHPIGRRRADFAYLQPKVAIELDGLGSHFSAEAFQADRERQNELVLAGFIPLRFTWDDVNDRWPRVERTIRRALRLTESG